MLNNTAHYTAILAKKYPDLPPKAIHELCLTLMRRIYGHAAYNHDIRITSPAHKLSLKIYTPMFSSVEHNAKQQVVARRRWVRRRISTFKRKRA